MNLGSARRKQVNQTTVGITDARWYGRTLITKARVVQYMPVSITHFETGDLPRGPSVPERVVAYLYLNRDHAFTRAEIAAALDANPNTVGTALSRLKARGLLRHRNPYWALTDDLQRVSAAYDLHTVSERFDSDDGGIDAAEWDAAAPTQPHPSERTGDEGDQ